MKHRSNKDISESGAITTGRTTADNLFQPDYVRPRTNIISTSRGTAVPMQWRNGPTFSGGNEGAGSFRFGGSFSFGANPKSKKNVLSYKDFIGKSKSFSDRKK